MERHASLLWAPSRPDHADGEGTRPDEAAPLAAFQGRSLFELFCTVARRRGEAVAVDDGLSQLSYAALEARAQAVAVQLAHVPLGRPVASLIGPTVNYTAILLGALAAGVPLAPIDPNHPRERQIALLRETRPALVLVAPGDAPHAGLLEEGVPWQPLATTRTGTSSLAIRGGPEDLSGVAFTSGSTGRPKGLAYSQAATLAFVLESVRALAISESDRLISLASLAAGGNLDILAAVLTGARVRLLDLKSAGMGEALRVMADEHVTLVSMVPLVFRALLSAPEGQAAFAAVRAITMGGDRVTGADVALFRSRLPQSCAIRVTQGSTESAVVFHGVLNSSDTLGSDDTAPSGWIAHDRNFALIDEGGGAVPIAEGAQGEVVVAARDMASGYWRDGQLTPGPFVDLEDGRQLFHTGDVVRLLGDGRVAFVGRRDRMIKILGLRADLAEIETALRSHPAIAEAAVVVRREGPAQEPRLLAVVRPYDLRSPPSASALRTFARAALPAHMVPVAIRVAAAIPRLPNYKVDGVALDALEAANAGGEESDVSAAAFPDPSPSPPPAPILRAVRRAWDGVLGEGASGRAWEEAGGDSLKQLQLLLRLERDLGRRFSFDLFAGSFTAASLARRIASEGGQRECGPTGPRVFLAPGLGGDEPSLAELRRLLETELDFHVLKFPDLDEPDRLGDRDAIIADVLDQIGREQPQGPLNLLGYSLGGAVAFEAAKRLSDQGRSVAFLGLIDVPAGFVEADPSRLPSRRPLPFNIRDPLRGLRHAVVGAMFAALGVSAMQRVERLTTRAWGAHRGMHLRQMLLERTRGAAFSGWRPQPYAGPLWLFRADEQPASETRPDLGWSGLATRLTVVSTPGTHHSLMREGVDALSARLLRALTTLPPPGPDNERPAGTAGPSLSSDDRGAPNRRSDCAAQSG